MSLLTDSTPQKAAGDSSLKIPPKPSPQDFEPRVAWLFGRQLLANLKWILIYAAFKGKLDPGTGGSLKSFRRVKMRSTSTGSGNNGMTCANGVQGSFRSF